MYSLQFGNIVVPVNDTDFALTIQSNDFRDFNEIKRRTISKTLTVYGNDNINKIFFSFFEIKSVNNLITDYDVRKQIDCVLLSDGEPIMEGAIILKEIKIEKGVIVYSVVFKSQELKRFGELANYSLRDLEYYDIYNHILNISNVTDTWEGWNRINNIKTLVWNNSPRVPLGNGYIYPIGFYGALTQKGNNIYDTEITNNFNLNKLIPFFGVKEMFEKSFAKVGITATLPPSLTSKQWFKSLFISGNYDQYKRNIDGYEASYTTKFSATITNDENNMFIYGYGGVYYCSRTLSIYDINPTIIQNDNLLYDTTDGMYLALRSGKIKIKIAGNYQCQFPNAWHNHTIVLKISRANGTTVCSVGLHYRENEVPGTYNINYEYEFDCIQNEKYKIELGFQYRIHQGPPPEFRVDYNLTDCSIINSYTANGYGDIVIVRDWLPKMKLNEFVSGIIRLLNLQIKSISDTSIEFCTVDEYYEDWSKQIRLDKWLDTNEMTIQDTVIAHNIKELKIKYKQPEDWLNNYYKNSYRKAWGEFANEINTNIATEKKEIEIPFSVIVPNQIENYGNIIIPTIYNFNNNKFEGLEFAPMLAIFTGVMSWQVKLYYFQNGAWQNTGVTNVPLMLNAYRDVTNSDYINLLFQAPEATFYNDSNFQFQTNYTIYKAFHEPSWYDILADGGKVVTCKVSPKVFERYGIDVLPRKIYTIDGVPFRLNKIADYSKNKNVVNIELVKILEPRRAISERPIIVLDSDTPYKPPTAIVRSISYSGGRDYNLQDNELWTDIDKAITGIGNKILSVGKKQEYIGIITQSGTNDPILRPLYSSFEVEFERVNVGLYKTTTAVGNTVCVMMSLDSSPIFINVKKYITNGFLYIDIGQDGMLNHIIKLIKYE